MPLLRPLRWMLPLAGVVLAGCAVVPAEPAYPGPVVYGGTMAAPPVGAYPGGVYPVAPYPGAVVSGGVVLGGPAYYGAPVYGPPPVFWGPPAPVFVRPHYGGPRFVRPGGPLHPHAAPGAGSPGNGSIGSAIRGRRRSQ